MLTKSFPALNFRHGQIVVGNATRLLQIEHVGSGKNGTVQRMLITDGQLKGVMTAVKFLHNLEDDDTKTRFHREVQILKSVKHPHVISILDEGEFKDIKGRIYPFYVMEYQPRNLESATRMHPRGMNPAEVLRLSLQIASALAYIHAKDIAHRDFKPGNILFDGGNAKIADFGLAKNIADDNPNVPRITIEGKKVGPRSHLSPEQFRHWKLESDLVPDKPSDVYQFGLVMYELLTGVNPNVISAWKKPGPRIPTTANIRTLSGSLRKGLSILVRDMLCDLPSTRPSAVGVLDTLFSIYQSFSSEYRALYGRSPGGQL